MESENNINESVTPPNIDTYYKLFDISMHEQDYMDRWKENLDRKAGVLFAGILVLLGLVLNKAELVNSGHAFMAGCILLAIAEFVLLKNLFPHIIYRSPDLSLLIEKIRNSNPEELTGIYG